MSINTSIPHSRPNITGSDIEAVVRALGEKSISSYRYAELLKEQLQLISGFRECLLFATGTLALRSALLQSGVPGGSGIAISSFTCPDLLSAIVSAGYQPVVIDCDKQGLLDAEKVENALGRGMIKGAVAVHQFGLINAGMQELADRMPVIEDCCHVPPRGYLRGSRAVFGSFEGTKLLGAGEGGYLLLPEASSHASYDACLLGNRLTDLVAVLALKQLERLECNLQRRETIAATYREHLPAARVVDGRRACWFRLLLKLDSLHDVERLISQARDEGITLRRPIMPYPLHRIAGESDQAYPAATALWERLVSIPLYPDLTESEIARVAQFIERSRI